MTVANTLEQVAWLMDRSGEAALITDAAGIIQYVNPAFEHMTGFPKGPPEPIETVMFRAHSPRS